MKREVQINLSQSHLIYELDEKTRVTPLTIQEILNLRNKSDIHKGMKKAFDLLHNLRTMKKEPENVTLKQAIIQELQTMKNSESQKKQPLNQFQGYRFDPNKFYLMNKAGGIGMIERKCKFTQKGVLQSEEGKKQPKLKQIKGFNNVIEKFKEKGNISKLDWVKQNTKYPFRIVLIDKNKADKGIYFQTLPQACSIQIYLIQKYNSKQQNGKVKELFGKLAQQRENKIVEDFISKFRPYSVNIKSLRKSFEKSREKTNIQMVEPNSSRQQKNTISKYDKQSILENNKNRQSNTLSQYHFNDQKGSNQILIEDTRTEVNFKKKTNKQLQSMGKNNNQMKIPQINVRKVNEKLKAYNELNIKEFFSLWRSKVENLSNQKQGKSVRQNNLSRSPNNNVIEKILLQNRVVELAQKEQEKLTNLIRFNSLELYLNPIIPMKPYVKIEVQNRKIPKQQMGKGKGKGEREGKELSFNTFQRMNQKNEDQRTNISYELILDNVNEDGEQNSDNLNEALISPNHQNYQITITLINTVTGDVVISRQLTLDNIKVQGQNFSLLINESIQQEQQNISSYNENNSPLMKIFGTIQNTHPKQQVKTLFNYLFMNLDFLSKPQIQTLQNNPTSNHLHDQQFHSDQNLITLIPQIQPQFKLKLNQIITQSTFHLLHQSSYLPIENLKPLSPTQQQLTILSVSAQFLKTTNIPPVAYRYLLILRMLIGSNLFKSQSQLMEGFVAIIMNWSGQFFACNNNELNLAKIIGFEDNQIDKTSQKITVSLQLIEFLLSKECPFLLQKMKRRNIPLQYLCLEYCHNMLVINFQSKCALSILTWIFNSYDKSHEILLILVQIYLCKYNEEELVNCYKLEEVQFLLQNSLKNPQSALNFLMNSSLQTQIQQFITQKWNMYFSEQHNDKYISEFETIKSNFYEREGEQLRNKKQRRFAQKSNLIQKFTQINSLSPIKPPVYKPKPHCLHIYFVSVPKISGSLYLKTSYTQFECVDYEKSPYFVISNLDSKVQLEFIDSKSNHYNFNLIFDAGFGFFKHQFHDTKNSVTLRFQYWSGLFEESSIDYQYKNIKDIQSSLSSQLTQRDLKYKLNKEFDDSKLMRAIEKVCLNNGKSDVSLQELSRKIKTAFSQFQNKVNEYDLFLNLVAQRKVSFEQKLHTLFEFAKCIEQELFLSQNSCLDQMVLYDFFKIMDIPIKFRQFEALYQSILSRETETCVPKVFKARFLFMYEEHRQVKLQNEVYQYIYERADKFVYKDIDIKELFNYVKQKILSQIAQVEREVGRKLKLDEGELKLVISSEGEIQHYLFKVTVKNNNRQFTVEDQFLPQLPYFQKLKNTTPKVLYQHKRSQSQKHINTNENQQNLVSALKSMSRFNPNNMKTSITIESRMKLLMSQNNINTQGSEISEFEKTNLCKFIIPKYRRIIPFRYKAYPKQVAFKSFNFFADLNMIFYGIKQNKELHSIKQCYLNDRQVKTLQFLNDWTKSYKIGASQNSELYHYRPEIGLFNNLHLVKQKNPNITQVYFYTSEQVTHRPFSGKALINHGFGVIRWENVRIKGYFRVRSEKRNKKQKDVYLVEVNSKDKLTEQKHLKTNYFNEIKFLGEISEKALSKMSISKI